jgi:hypothetical protein
MLFCLLERPAGVERHAADIDRKLEVSVKRVASTVDRELAVELADFRAFESRRRVDRLFDGGFERSARLTVLLEALAVHREAEGLIPTFGRLRRLKLALALLKTRQLEVLDGADLAAQRALRVRVRAL